MNASGPTAREFLDSLGKPTQNAQSKSGTRGEGGEGGGGGIELKQSNEVDVDYKRGARGDSSPGRKKKAIDEWRSKSMEKDRSQNTLSTVAPSKCLNDTGTFKLTMDSSKSVDLSHLKFKLTPSQQNTFKEFLTSSEDPTNDSTLRGDAADSKNIKKPPQTARASYEEVKIDKMKSNCGTMMKTLDKLSRGVNKEADPDEPVIRDKTKEFLLFEEAEECTFKPKLHAYTNSENKNDDKKKKDKDVRIKEWLALVENKERTRKTLLEKTTGERDYKDKIDKKWCPSCKKTQTYDEFSENKKKCSDCKIPFRYKTVVTYDKLKKFFGAQSKLFEDSRRKLEKKREEVLFDEKATEVKVFDKELMKTVSVKKNLMDSKIYWDEEKKNELSDRLREDKIRRQEELKKIEDEAYATTCTFRPVISSKKSSDDADGSSGGAFMERLDAEIERRRERGLVKSKVEASNQPRWIFGKNDQKKKKTERIVDEENTENF